MNTNQLPKGVCVVLLHESHFAISQRYAKDGEPTGVWQFPGGHVEEGEEPLMAAMRELREETGLAIPAGRFVFLGHTPPLTGYKSEQYIGYRYGVVLNNDEHPQHTEPDRNSAWSWVHWRTRCCVLSRWSDLIAVVD